MREFSFLRELILNYFQSILSGVLVSVWQWGKILVCLKLMVA